MSTERDMQQMRDERAMDAVDAAMFNFRQANEQMTSAAEWAVAMVNNNAQQVRGESFWDGGAAVEEFPALCDAAAAQCVAGSEMQRVFTEAAAACRAALAAWPN